MLLSDDRNRCSQEAKKYRHGYRCGTFMRLAAQYQGTIP